MRLKFIVLFSILCLSMYGKAQTKSNEILGEWLSPK